MANINISNLYSRGWAASNSWSYDITIPDGNEPSQIIVVLYAKYIDFTGDVVTVGGNATTSYTSNSGTAHIGVFVCNVSLPAGTYAVAASGMGTTYGHGAWVYSFYPARGINGLIVADQPSTPYTASPNLVAGYIWFEVTQGNVAYASASSSQTTLNSNSSSYFTRSFYKQDNGAGQVNFTHSNTSSNLRCYIGLEVTPIPSDFIDTVGSSWFI